MKYSKKNQPEPIKEEESILNFHKYIHNLSKYIKEVRVSAKNFLP